MAQCPVCQSNITEDFGLIECAQCKTPLLVQMDGSVQSMAETNSKISAHPTEEKSITRDFQPEGIGEIDLSEMLVDEAMSAPAEAFPPQPLPDEASPDDSFEISEAPIVGRHEEPVAPPPLPGDEVAEAAPPEDAGPEVSEASIPEGGDVDAFFDDQEPQAVVMEQAQPISDLSTLANETEMHTGSLRYNILIAGIDTADIRKEFRDLISDRRFLWDVEGILKSIQSGKVRVKDVSAVKAILLVHRLRSLPVQVQWEQHVVHAD